jgi:hypothetical protein
MEFLITLYATLIRVRNSGRHPHSASTSDPWGTYYTEIWNTSTKTHLEPELLWRWPHDYVIWNNTTCSVVQKSLPGCHLPTSCTSWSINQDSRYGTAAAVWTN